MSDAPAPFSPPLPMTPDEVDQRGWDAVDWVFVTGDAYVDHPAFAAGLLARVLESEGFRVAVLAQPDWHSCDAWRRFGRPRLGFAVSAGNMDSMIHHYTASRKVRNDDPYSPGGRIGLRPDRASLAYCQRAREAYPGVPVLLGGVEASLRRLAHYDYWSDKVRRSLLLDAKADLLIYGMGEATLVEVARRLAAGQSPREMRDLRGVVYRLGASEPVPEDARTVPLPEYAAVRDDRYAFAEMTRLAYEHLDPRGEVRLVQRHGTEAIVVNPPALPLDSETLDRYYELPFTRREHPAYGEEKVPALEVVRHSIQVVRGCAGGCAFCSLTAHQGRELRSRSRESVVREAEQMVASPDFRGTITDLGGPTANMYGMGCRRPDDRGPCRRQSCLHPEICRHLKTDHRPAMELMEAVRKVEGVDRVFIASGVRTDLAQRSEAYLKMLLRHHVGGHLKTAPEHVSPEVLDLMHKPPIENYDRFARCFQKLTHHVGKPKQYLVPYFLAGLPGSDPAAMIELACYLKRNRLRPRQVQDFIPGPFDPATCMYHTGLDPMTGREVYVPRGARQRRRQRALLQYFLPENDREVREALIEAGRTDLIGSGPECLIPERPPKGARKGTRRKAPRGAKHRPTGKRGAPPPGKPRPRKKGR